MQLHIGQKTEYKKIDITKNIKKLQRIIYRINPPK